MQVTGRQAGIEIAQWVSCLVSCLCLVSSRYAIINRETSKKEPDSSCSGSREKNVLELRLSLLVGDQRKRGSADGGGEEEEEGGEVEERKRVQVQYENAQVYKSE